MKGRTAGPVNLKISRSAGRLEGRAQADTTAPERTRPAARHVPWHVIAQRRARNRMRATTRKKQRR